MLHHVPGQLSLTADQHEQFRRDGYVAIKGAFSGDVSRRCNEAILDALTKEQQVDLERPATARYGVGRRAGAVFDEMVTDRLTSAFDELAGPGRWNREHLETHGNFWITFPGFHGTQWKPPVGTGRWHIDLGFESRDAFAIEDGNCAFVAAFLITPSHENGAPTVALRGSHHTVARLLWSSDRPVPRFTMVAFCEGYATTRGEDVVQLVGEAGDVVLLHPYLVHAASANTISTLRVMSNTGVGLTGPRRVGPQDGGRSVIEEIIVEDRPDVGDARRILLRGVLAVNHRLWKWRYAVSGQLPSFVEPSLPLWRKVPERLLRRICASLSDLALALVR